MKQDELQLKLALFRQFMQPLRQRNIYAAKLHAKQVKYSKPNHGKTYPELGKRQIGRYAQ